MVLCNLLCTLYSVYNLPGNLTFIIIYIYIIYSLIAEDIYNALVIHGLCALEKLPESVMKVEPFWNTTGYNIGGHNFSLHDILHGVLRGEHILLLQL